MRDEAIPGSTSHASANRIGVALSTLFRARQLPALPGLGQIVLWLEAMLERERDQLALWVPVAIALGIAGWYRLANPYWWIALMLAGVALALIMSGMNRQSRISHALVWTALLIAAGCALIWLRSWSVAEAVLERPVVTSFYGQVEATEIVTSRNIVRLTLRTNEKQSLPLRVRVNVPIDAAPPDLRKGSLVRVRARLMPPAMAALPGAYDFSERAWFRGLGATGVALDPPAVVKAAPAALDISVYRQRLSAHVRAQMDGGAGAIAATLATGDRGAISDGDAEAMRRSGLAHLLSISGLHVTAVVGAVYIAVLKLLALSPPLALHLRLPIIAAGCAALAAIGYTLLTGAQVPTVRACVAALLVLLALILGRSAITLRMVAAGALFVLIFWPESLVGPSFQLSFAAVTAIIALHEHPRVKALFALREESAWRRAARFVFSLFLTGLVVEIALMPIALYHFHKAGVYGALANIVAIPLTTFVIMPLEALALLLDCVGMGAPIWWVCGYALNGLISLAHFVSSSPGAVTMLPTMPIPAFALMVLGGVWLCLWRERWRYLGLVPAMIGALLMLGTRTPDIYVTGDGRHVGIMDDSGNLAMLRTRSGDFIRDMILENAGVDGDAAALQEWPNADCNADSCSVTLEAGGRDWVLLATRSRHHIPALALSAACRRADIVVSERRLPGSCQPRWLKLDAALLSKTGGMTIDLANQRVETVLNRNGRHAWTRFEENEQNGERPAQASPGERQ